MTRHLDAHRVAASAILDAYQEGRPIKEIRDNLAGELEAVGQLRAAEITRAFFTRLTDATRHARGAQTWDWEQGSRPTPR